MTIYENDCPSPDRSENPFVAVFATKDWNELLRQFALSGSGAGLAPKKNYASVVLILDTIKAIKTPKISIKAKEN